jgi:hypothetical protein
MEFNTNWSVHFSNDLHTKETEKKNTLSNSIHRVGGVSSNGRTDRQAGRNTDETELIGPHVLLQNGPEKPPQVVYTCYNPLNNISSSLISIGTAAHVTFVVVPTWIED